jgi:hypothetical protein
MFFVAWKAKVHEEFWKQLQHIVAGRGAPAI